MNRPITGQEKKSVRLHVLLEPHEIEAVDDYRYRARIPTRAEAIRQLLKLGLSVADAPPAEVAKG